ncbi:MAG: hypothetical protein KF914_12510 [Rhizobiaceae bacterium]|nr:hypothetical protein [Rhizobiaceae bacterium]
MGLREKAHLRRALANGTATIDQMREALDALWSIVEAVDARLDIRRRAVTLSADNITLTSGNATIELNKDGSITIRGSGTVEVKGSGDLQLYGHKVRQN